MVRKRHQFARRAGFEILERREPLTADMDFGLNHAPWGVDNTVATLEGEAYIFSAADFGFSDPDDAAAPPLYNVPSADKVLVLYNAASSSGQTIANYYAQVHPGVRLLGITGVNPNNEEITDVDYLSIIRPQVLAALTDSIDYIVTTKGMPLRIRVTATPPTATFPNMATFVDSLGITHQIASWKTYSSLESELANIDRVDSALLMGDQSYGFPNSAVVNPYYLSNTAFSHATYGTRLTARLDGYTVADVLAAIDRAQHAQIGTANGPDDPFYFVVDNDPSRSYSSIMNRLVDNVLTPGGIPVVYDYSSAFISTAPGAVIAYDGHGDHQPSTPDYYLLNGIQFTLAAGAVFQSWESFNAYSFNPTSTTHINQGQIAQWLQIGGTAGVGTVEEPGASTSTLTNEDQMFEMLLAGRTFAEAAWSATLQTSWVNTMVGDPLMVWQPWDHTPDDLLAIKISSLPTTGVLSLNGVAVSVGQFISAADIAGGALRFTPLAGGGGAGYANFAFQVQDDGGTAYGGADLDPTSNTMTINVNLVEPIVEIAPNVAPSGTDKTVTIPEDSQFVFSLADFGFSDADLNHLQAIKITTLPNAGGLTFNGNSVVAAQYFTVAEIASGQLVLQLPANGAGDNLVSFTFQVQDDGGTTNGGVDLDPIARTFEFNVTNINDAPTGASRTIATAPNVAYTFSAGDFGFSDANDSPADSLVAVRINSRPALGTLALNGVVIAVGQLVSLANINAGKLKYTPPANALGAGYASFTFQVQDSGGTAGGGVDLDPTPKTITVNVVPVNKAPSGNNRTVTVLEDTTYTFSAADFTFVDGNKPANALQAVKISSLPAAGRLTLFGAAVQAGRFVSAAELASGGLQFMPAANANKLKYATFNFQVQDDGGTAFGGIDFDSTPNTVTINVTAVNDAPTGADKTVTVLEDKAYVFTLNDFGFRDSDANALQAIRIATLPTAGTLTKNGAAVQAGAFIAAADIKGGKFKFTPAANANGLNYASFTFQVQDNGGTANGGNNLDAIERTITINGTAVNDAPTGTSNTVTTLEDTAYTFSLADFGFSDAKDATGAIAAVKITATPKAGALTKNGVAVKAGQFISAGDIVNGVFRFTPAANAARSGYASFTFQVQDDGGTANGGLNLDPAAKVMNINVLPVNDAPSGTDKTVTILEDSSYAITLATFGFSDKLDTPASALIAVQITKLPEVGTLKMGGVDIVAGQWISAADFSAGAIYYTPPVDAFGANIATIDFRVQDSGGTDNGGANVDPSPNRITINVTAVNDAPTGTNNNLNVTPGIALALSVANFGFGDAHDSPANAFAAVKITTLPTAGVLTNNGANVKAGQVISLADLNSGKLKFVSSAGAFGFDFASFTFQVQDNGGTANGGLNLDPLARIMSFSA